MNSLLPTNFSACFFTDYRGKTCWALGKRTAENVLIVQYGCYLVFLTFVLKLILLAKRWCFGYVRLFCVYCLLQKLFL